MNKKTLNSKFLSVLLAGASMSLGASAQSLTVKGHVQDVTGEPVVFATVSVPGTKTMTQTDANGNFKLNVNPGSNLRVAYIGYKTATVKADGTVTITLEDNSTLNEAVVIGYGVAKKTDLTGSVTAIKPDDKNHGLQTSAQDMIQGKIAGVNVVSNSGAPGGSATIRIRGGSSLNAKNDPLIVIDGLAMDNDGIEGSPNALTLVNPNDIESFTVLKDASATAIYGSRASNGVIIITTKKGRKSSKPRVTYNGNVSVSVNTKYMDVLNAQEYINLVRQRTGLAGEENEEAWLNSDYYRTLGYWTAAGEHKFADTDWQKEIYRTAVSTDHNITVSGGTKNMPYRVSFGYTYQNGTLKTSNFNRYTGSFNLSPSLLDDHLNINLNGKFMYSKSSYANTDAIGQALTMDPTKPVYDDRDQAKWYGGYWQWDKTTDFNDSEWTYDRNTLAVGNPVAALNQQKNIGKSHSIQGNLELDYKVHGFEDLRFHVNGGMEVAHGHSDKTCLRTDYANMYYGSKGWNESDKYNLSLNMYAQYYKDFNASHHFDAMVGYEWQHFHRKTDYDYPVYYPSTYLGTDDNGNSLAGTLKNPNYYAEKNSLFKTEYYLVSFFGRINYSYKSRYLFTFTLRDDGSSRFSKDNRWGLFPAVALAWKAKEETFLKNIDAVTDAKLRLGWGITGQQEHSYGDYVYMPNYVVNMAGAFYPIVGDGTTYRPEAYNKNLTWEKTTTYNVGVDLGFWNNRVTANLDWYYRKTTDLLNTGFVAVGSNFSSSVLSNIGSLHNTGFEAMLTVRPIQTKDWSWELAYNIGWNKNKIDELVASQGADYYIANAYCSGGKATADNMIKAWKAGQAASAFYVYQQVYDEKGQPIYGEFVDRNADGKIDYQDRYFYKKSDADVTMGLTSKLTYKRWDLGLTFRASLNNYAYNGVEAGDNMNTGLTHLYNGNSWHNVLQYELAKNWSESGATASCSDYFVQNASFLKLDNITLGYSFDKIAKAPISGRVYATAQNVFTITKYKGLDPEIDGGYDGNVYPRPFTCIVGVTLNF